MLTLRLTWLALALADEAEALLHYEIYKAGHDLHWQPGLDLFGPYGLKLVFVPHWNNAEGGAELDTSRCFMGRSRFDILLAMLPADVTVVGIAEHTALAIDLDEGVAQVMGAGDVTVLRGPQAHGFSQGGRFSLAAHEADEGPAQPPAEVLSLVAEREAARAHRDWATADALRARIADLGWQVQDTPAGPVLEHEHRPTT